MLSLTFFSEGLKSTSNMNRHQTFDTSYSSSDVFVSFGGGVGSGGNKEKGLVASRENWYFMVLKGLKVRIHVQKMEAGVI